MQDDRMTHPIRITRLHLVLALLALPALGSAQDRLKTYPGYDQYQRMLREYPTMLKSGAVTQVNWADATSVTYMTDGKRFRFDINTGQSTEVPPPPQDSTRGGRGVGGGPERGRQFDSATSPDGKLKAFYKD